MKCSAVLFDFDGVLADTAAAHRWAWKTAFEGLFSQNFEGFSPDELTGPSSLEIARGLTLKVNQEEKFEELAHLKLKFLLNTLSFTEKSPGPRPHFFPGVGELFDLLSHQGIPYAVVSNAPGVFILQMFLTAGITVPVLVSGTDGLSPKPSPQPYLKAAELWKVPQEDFPKIFVLEDTLPGLNSALSARMIPIGVSTSLTPFQLYQAGAVSVIPSVRELPSLWEGRSEGSLQKLIFPGQ